VTALEVRGLRLNYGEREVLHGIDLALGHGELMALLGPNGAGKSSLLRCVSGLARPTIGTVALDGVPLDELSRAGIAKRIAVVAGQTHFAFPIRVEEVVALGRVPHEHPLLGPRLADQAAIAAAIDRVGVGHLLGRDVRELSLGERQLVVLAMSIAQGARLLLLDEPTVHLDLRHQVQVMELLVDLAERDGVTVLAVVHDVRLASHFFPRVALLEEGRLMGDGAPADVLTADNIRAVFGVDPRLVQIPV
jgi:iron complex transport system ATP-binding protein